MGGEGRQYPSGWRFDGGGTGTGSDQIRRGAVFPVVSLVVVFQSNAKLSSIVSRSKAGRSVFFAKEFL